MGDSCSVCFGTRDKEATLYTTDLLDINNISECTPEPKNIGTDDDKANFDPKRVTKDERSYNLEDKVSETKNSRAATLSTGRSECVHPLEDSKKTSSSEVQDMLERKDTDELVSFALEKENFVPGPLRVETKERKRKVIIKDELKREAKMDTLLPVSHIKTDSEFIHEMLYSSDSSDSFGCYQEESKNRF